MSGSHKMLSEDQMHAGKGFLRAYLDALHTIEYFPPRQSAQKTAGLEAYRHVNGLVKSAHDQSEVLFDGSGNLVVGPNFRNNYLLQLYRFTKPVVETCSSVQDLNEQLDSLLVQTRKDLAAAKTKA